MDIEEQSCSRSIRSQDDRLPLAVKSKRLRRMRRTERRWPLQAQRYIRKIRGLLQEFEESQNTTVLAVGRLIAERVREGGCIHLFDSGHLLGSEFVYRAGGIAIISKVELDDIRVPSRVRRGDVVIIASVSGRREKVIDAASISRERGATVVALTSLAQSEAAVPKHESGKLLKDMADYIIDIGGEVGDAALEFDGLNMKACPTSGVMQVVCMWAISAEVISNLLDMGLTPTVFVSANAPGGEKCSDQMSRFICRGI